MVEARLAVDYVYIVFLLLGVYGYVSVVLVGTRKKCMTEILVCLVGSIFRH